MRSAGIVSVAMSAAVLAAGAGVTSASIGNQGISLQGISLQGISLQGISLQGISLQGISLQGISLQGISLQGISLQGTQLGGWRWNGAAGWWEYRYTDSYWIWWNSTWYGPYSSGLDNSLIQAEVTDPESGTTIDLTLRIASHERDTSTNTMVNPAHQSNNDIWLHRVEVRADDGTWHNVCPNDGKGFFTEGGWDDDGNWSPGGFTFACTTGVISKCARGWGYKPWATLTDGDGYAHGPADMRELHQSCVHAARAAYCGNFKGFTQDGTAVDMFDNYGLNEPVGEDVRNGMFASEALFHGDGAYALLGFTRFLDWGHVLDGCHAGAHIHENYISQPSPGSAGSFTPSSLQEWLGYAWHDRAFARANGLHHVGVSTSTNCSHTPAEVGEPLYADCNECTRTVCEQNPTCCNFWHGWDALCVEAALDTCGEQAFAETLPWREDSFEPNDSISAAKWMWSGYYPGLFAEYGKVDYFRVLGGGTVTVEFPHAEGDLNVHVFDSYGAYVGGSYTSTDDETVTVPSNGYILVYAMSGVANTYAVNVGGVDPVATIKAQIGCRDLWESNNTLGTARRMEYGYNTTAWLCGGESDYYFVDDTGEFRIDFSHAEGNLNLAVYSSAGKYLRGSFTSNDYEAVTVNAGERVRVYGVSGASARYSAGHATGWGYLTGGSSFANAHKVTQVEETRMELIPYQSQWFHLQLGGTATIRFDHARGNLNMTAYTPSGWWYGSSSTTGDLEKLADLPPGTRIKIWGQSGAGGTFAMQIM